MTGEKRGGEGGKRKLKGILPFKILPVSALLFKLLLSRLVTRLTILLHKATFYYKAETKCAKYRVAPCRVIVLLVKPFQSSGGYHKYLTI